MPFYSSRGTYARNNRRAGNYRPIYVGISQVCSDYKTGSYLSGLPIVFARTGRGVVSKTYSMGVDGIHVVASAMRIRPITFRHNFCSISVVCCFTIAIRTCATTNTVPRAIANLTVCNGEIILCNNRNYMGSFSDSGSIIYSASSSSYPYGCPCYLPETAIRVSGPVTLSTGLRSGTGPVAIYEAFPAYIVSCLSKRPTRPRARQILIAVNVFAVAELRESMRVVVPSCSFYIPHGRYPSTPSSPYRIFDGVSFPASSFFPPGTVRHNSHSSSRASSFGYNYRG